MGGQISPSSVGEKSLESQPLMMNYTYHMIKVLEEKNDGLFDYQGERDKTTWAK